MFNLALIYKNKIKDFDRALKLLNHLILINPTSSIIYNTIGNIKLEMK
jgi:hypothetical protein